MAQRGLMMYLRFFGGTGTVTGSRYLVEHGKQRLLVDCGMFQGLKQLRLRNWVDFPVPPDTIDAVVLTHAHIDHSGYLPRLVQRGFRGKVFATRATGDLCKLLLPDSARLLEEEAAYANRHQFSKHSPAQPLYTESDARRVLRHFKAIEYETTQEVLPGMQVTLTRAGHILGAASVHLAVAGRSILFSGDLGRSDDLLMKAPEPPRAADLVLIESTYGDRTHPADDSLTQLAEVVCRTAARGGIVIVPAFAVGRAQMLLHALHVLKSQHRIPNLPVFLNSPMAANVTSIFRRHSDEHRLNAEEVRAMCGGVKITNSEEASRSLNDLRFPSVIVSASGMATGGRVVHHLKAFAPDPRNAIVFAGFQAAGTRGAAMLGGATSIKIHGEWVPVRAEVANLGGFSAHADRVGLLEWIGALPRAPQHVYVIHGEPVAADSLRQAIEERHHWPCTVPEHLQAVSLRAE